ncbi:MAG: hypothetical protein WDN27_06315 [Candidatus Saccharibacteria bacterium]
MLVHAYLCTRWKGEPTETEEMAPKWFSETEIPYNEMWEDDQYWLPRVFTGKLLRTVFAFDADDHLLNQQITEVESF